MSLGVTQVRVIGAPRQCKGYDHVVGAIDCDKDFCEYPSTDEPVWMLGHHLSAKYDVAELRQLVVSRPWMTYRKDFPAIGESGLTSDQVCSH